MAQDRFERHRALVGDEGIKTLQQATVAVCGAGGLGSTVLTLLARTGVGHICIYDSGSVDTPDLNRQILYDSSDLGMAKAARAAARLSALKSHIDVEARAERVGAETQFGDVDLVVDCLDNFESRFAVDTATYEAGVPLVHAGVYEYFGQITSIHRAHTRSLRELFDASTTDLDKEQGKPMFPPAVVCVAAIEASECINILLERSEKTLYRRLATVDIDSLEVTTIPFL